LRFFFFCFSEGETASPALDPSERGWCHARASAALAHLSAKANSSAIECTSWVPSFSSILITDAVTESDDDRVRSDPGDGVAYLAKALDELPQRLALALNDRMEVALRARAFEGALKIHHELVAEVLP
jgi:hypothetical protein